MNQHRQADPFPEPPDAGTIARWLAALPERLGMWRHWRWWLIGSMLAVVALAVLHAPIGALLWPQTRAQALHDEAEQALARGLLTADDGRGARELFEAALAMDPDRGAARQGLARVAIAALAQARTALAEDRFDDAHRELALARALSVPRADADALAEALRLREAEHAGVDGLFAHATQVHAQGRLDAGSGSALPLYARVLALQPGHAGALRGREDALAELLAQARESLRAGDVDEAVRLVGTVREYDPVHVDLADTQARLMEETGLDGEGIARVLAGEARPARRTDAAVPDDALDPASPSAVEADMQGLPEARDCHARALRGNALRRAGECLDARAALGDDPGDLAAARRQLAERWLAVGDERLGAGEIALARSALAAARKVDPAVPGLADFELRVRAAAAALRFD
ncbi:hypothetical protein WCE41_11235 [Luteimonas sp. MJ246]|uniref:hypothetical protein n=1 Tax=Luteimonas sp. MJ174 TaxID=3129237 RepID=UPI0031BA1594